MSSTIQTYEQAQTCVDCGEPVTLRQKKNSYLIVACACAERSVRVASVTPNKWQ